MTSEDLVNIDSGNSLMPDGTTPLHEPVLTYYHWVKIESLKWVWKLHFSQETMS